MFGGHYDALAPRQKEKLHEWVDRYNEIMGQHLEPSGLYEELPMLTRTTFEAVTHALMTTELTDEEGRSLGTAVDLVRLVETVHGEIVGVGGDHQFRIYAFLAPKALEVLEKSREFTRHADNTVYHLDYPINYRQNGVPSIQFSVARDGERADIDVNYRSSAFPVLLFDGHLTAANSDIRAGDNYDRHLSRWQGFLNWWRQLSVCLLPLNHSRKIGAQTSTMDPFPTIPRVRSTEAVAMAVEDFLSTWLVQRQPERVMPYFAERSYACVLDLEPESTDAMMAPFRILRDLKEVNLVLGPVGHLGEALEGVEPPGLDPHFVSHPYEDQFVLFDLPPGVVEGFECYDPNAPLPPWHERPDQKFYGASMRLRTEDAQTFDLFLIWTAEEGHWKIAAFHVDPHADSLDIPRLRPANIAEVEREPKMPADPSLSAAVEAFLSDWLIHQRIDDAMEHVSPIAYECIQLFADPSELEKMTNLEELVRSRLRRIAEFTGRPENLGEALAPVIPWDPDLHVLAHEHEDAYALLSFSDHHAEQLDCRHRSEGRLYHGERERAHGTHFATMFKLRNAGDHPPAILFLWAEEEGVWRIISYDVMMH